MVISRATSSQLGNMHLHHHKLIGKEIDIHLYIYIYIYIFTNSFARAQGEFLSGVEQVWIQSFLSLRLVASPRLKNPVFPTIYPLLEQKESDDIRSQKIIFDHYKFEGLSCVSLLLTGNAAYCEAPGTSQRVRSLLGAERKRSTQVEMIKASERVSLWRQEALLF